MKAIITLILAGSLTGCATLNTRDDVGVPSFPTTNKTNLARLSTGMPKAEVTQVMGNGRWISSYGIRAMENPYRVATLIKDGKEIEVFWYYTSPTMPEGAVTKDDLTPIVIKDGKLAGRGWVALERLCQ